MPTDNLFTAPIAVQSPPGGGHLKIEGQEIYLTGVYKWECGIALYEEIPPKGDVTARFLGFLDANGNITRSIYYSTESYVLPWMFSFAGEALTLWRGKHHARKRLALHRAGGANAIVTRGAPTR